MGRSHKISDVQPPLASANEITPNAESQSECKLNKELDNFTDLCVTWTIRLLILLASVISWIKYDYLQCVVNNSWLILRHSWIFNSVYFETWWTTFSFAWIVPVYPFAIHLITAFDKYKIHPSVTYVHQTVTGMLKDSVIYMGPFMFLDSVMVKKYHNVNPSIWKLKQQSFIQNTRALPVDPPELGRVIFDLVASIMTFDAIFFIIHLFLHRNTWFYRKIHAQHHQHDVMHPHVTNKLTVVERIVLVLSANFALKLYRSHPLTRMLFVPLFVWLLVENHTGYDMPFGLHRVIPFNLYGGSVKHYKHHMHGSKYYQPFFTYLDYFLENKSNSKHKYQI
ncbi:cholesterol 25-hydroxylase-like isoform X2 [Saccostrea cucullata]